MVQLKGLFKLAPSLAIKYFKNKNNKFSWDWYELWQDAHKKSFTVAKVMREDILSSFITFEFDIIYYFNSIWFHYIY